MTIKKPADLATAAVLLAGIGFVYRESLNIDTSMNYASGPLFFPYVLLIAIGLLSLCLGARSIDFSSAERPARGQRRFEPAALFLQSACIGLVVVYLTALPRFGYVPCTIVFLFGSMLLLGPRSVKSAALYSVVSCAVTGGLYYTFARLLSLFLP
jgi:hypothetical protein